VVPMGPETFRPDISHTSNLGPLLLEAGADCDSHAGAPKWVMAAPETCPAVEQIAMAKEFDR
jgi:hypothetical protein